MDLPDLARVRVLAERREPPRINQMVVQIEHGRKLLECEVLNSAHKNNHNHSSVKPALLCYSSFHFLFQ